jgi:hypothetical protein
MLAAIVLPPEEQDHAFECELCEIAYTPADYSILLENKKIAYFSLGQEGLPQDSLEGVPSACICHNCLYDKLKKLSGGEIFKIKLICKDSEYVCAFDPDSDQQIM